MELPKGITLTHYQTKTGKRIKFKVRYQQGDFSACKSFDTLDLAIEYLTNCKSKYGRLMVSEQDSLRQSMLKAILEPSLESWLGRYFQYRYGALSHKEEKTRKYLSSVESSHRVICNTAVEYKTSYFPTGKDENLLGHFRLQEITPNVINSFIRSQLASGKKKISVVTYLSFINRFFNDLKYLDDRLASFNNPCKGYDRKLLKNALNRTAKSINPKDIVRLEDYLNNSSNKDVAIIFRLALLTACRRSELIFLTWDNVKLTAKQPYIEIKNSKSPDDRIVYLHSDAVKIIKDLHKKSTDKQGRIFTTSINAFERVFRRAVIALDLNGKVHFHMTRKTAITNLLTKSKDNALLVSALLGFNDPDKLANGHIDKSKDKMKQIAHKKGKTTLNSYLDINNINK